MLFPLRGSPLSGPFELLELLALPLPSHLLLLFPAAGASFHLGKMDLCLIFKLCAGSSTENQLLSTICPLALRRMIYISKKVSVLHGE